MSDRGEKIVALAEEMLAALALKGDRPASRYETVEIAALLYYTARETGTTEAALGDELRLVLNLASGFQSARDLDLARNYLYERLGV